MAAAPSRSDRRAVQNIRLLDGEGWYMRRKLGWCTYSIMAKFTPDMSRSCRAAEVWRIRRQLRGAMAQQRQAIIDQRMGVRW